MTLFRHAPCAVRMAITARERIVIRRARGSDLPALARLAELADAAPLPAPVLLAESDGALVAAFAIGTGRMIRDPFVASDDVAALLRLRATQLDQAA